MGDDRDRPLERRHRRAKRLGELELVLQEPAGHERGDDLGVGRDLGGNSQRLQRLQVGVVVDVPVERGRHVRPLDNPCARTRELLLVQRVGVGLGDDPDARPTRVSEHGRRRCL